MPFLWNMKWLKRLFLTSFVMILCYGVSMRASRLLSILIILQLRGRQTAPALAEELEVSVRTIHRDIDALSAAGVPVYGDRGPGGGFALLDGYRTHLTGLASEEAEALLLLGLPDIAQSMGLGRAAASARNKVLAALPATAETDAARIASCFHIDTADWYRALRPVPHLPAVARTVLDGKTARMTYQSWSAKRVWQIDPHGLVVKAGHWYLVAKGHGKLRMFNVADIQAFEALENRAEREPDFDLSLWWAGALDTFEARLRPDRALLRASPLGIQRLRLLGAHAGRAIEEAPPAEADGWRRIEFPIETIENAAPMLLGIGPELDILEPLELRKAVTDLAQAVCQRNAAGPASGTA